MSVWLLLREMGELFKLNRSCLENLKKLSQLFLKNQPQNNQHLFLMLLKVLPFHKQSYAKLSPRNSKIPKGQTEIVKSEGRQDHGKQNETKDKHRTHITTLKTKA